MSYDNCYLTSDIDECVSVVEGGVSNIPGLKDKLADLLDRHVKVQGHKKEARLSLCKKVIMLCGFICRTIRLISTV